SPATVAGRPLGGHARTAAPSGASSVRVVADRPSQVPISPSATLSWQAGRSVSAIGGILPLGTRGARDYSEPTMAQFSLFAALPPAARWRVRRAFEQAGAYSPEKAIAYEPPHWFEHRYFKRLREHGAVVEVQRGRYYADAPKLAEYV